MVLMMPQVGVDMREIGNDLTVDLIQSLRVALQYTSLNPCIYYSGL